MENEREAVEEAQPAGQEAPVERRPRRGGFGFGVLLGLATGAGLATLFTPVSGEKVRQQAAEKAPELWRHREELAREATSTVRSRLDQALRAGREAAREAEEESRHRFERLTGRKPDAFS